MLCFMLSSRARNVDRIMLQLLLIKRTKCPSVCVCKFQNTAFLCLLTPFTISPFKTLRPFK